jgi:hypothetical protein
VVRWVGGDKKREADDDEDGMGDFRVGTEAEAKEDVLGECRDWRSGNNIS